MPDTALALPPGTHYRDGWVWPIADVRGWPVIREEVAHIGEILAHVPADRRRVAVQAGGNCGLMVRPLADAFETVLTFEPHPRRFFKPDAPPFRLQSTRQLYWADDLAGPLPFGQVGTRALPHEERRMVATRGRVAEVFRFDFILVVGPARAGDAQAGGLAAGHRRLHDFDCVRLGDVPVGEAVVGRAVGRRRDAVQGAVGLLDRGRRDDGGLVVRVGPALVDLRRDFFGGEASDVGPEFDLFAVAFRIRDAADVDAVADAGVPSDLLYVP